MLPLTALTALTAIIIEPRRHMALRFVVENALETLPPTTKVVLFHGIKNEEFAKEIQNDRLQHVRLEIENLDQLTYSELLATKSIIYDYIHTPYFLVFQTDSMIFKKNKDLLQLFLTESVDYVGAPWLVTNYEPTKYRNFIGNGGLSLRRTAKMLEIIEKQDWTLLKDKPIEWLEDLFFTSDPTLKKPSYEEAKLFAVDEVFSEITFGCHRPWLNSHYAEFKKLYPEVEELRLLQGVVGLVN